MMAGIGSSNTRGGECRRSCNRKWWLFNFTSGVLSTQKHFFIPRKTDYLHLGRYKQPCVSHPEHVIVCYLKASKLVKAATRVAMCCFGMLLMALDEILSSFMSPDIFIRNVKKNKTPTMLTTNEASVSSLVRLLEGLSFLNWFHLTSRWNSFSLRQWCFIDSEDYADECRYLMTIDEWLVNQVVPLNDIISPTWGGGKLNHLKLKTKTLFAEFRAQQVFP